jgi:Rap1a immunity proteins
MQKPRLALVRVTAPIVLTAVILLSVRSAHAEVTLGELMRKCLLLENYWALKSTQDTTSSIPNDGSAICFGYLLAFRGLQGAVIGTVCASTQSCRRTLRFCIAEQTPDERILSAFIAYAGDHAHQWPEGAALHYLNAMHEAFPCKDDDRK